MYNRKTQQFEEYEDFRKFKPDLNSDNWFLHVMIDDCEGNYWLGTSGTELIKFRYDEGYKNFYIFDDNEGLTNYTILDMCFDHKRRLWIGTENGGLFQFDRKYNKFRRFKNIPEDDNSISSNSIWSIYEDPCGRIWLGTFDTGFDVIDPFSQKFKN